MANNYCPECDKDFKSITGLNGHNQFKHNKLPESLVSNNPTGRMTSMLELMKKQMAELKLEVQGLRADLEVERSDNRIGVFSGGNGNGNQGNGNGDREDAVQKYYCAGSKGGGKSGCGFPVTPDHEYCPNCGNRLLWNGVAVN